MFFKKRKAAEKKQRLETRAEREATIQAAIVKTGGIKDPAERIIELNKVAELIATEKAEEKADVAKNAKKIKTATNRVGFGAMAATMTTAGILSGGSLILLGLPVKWVGEEIADHRESSTKKKLTKEAATHFEKLDAFDAQVCEMIEREVENNVKAISKSPFYRKALAVPGVKQKFSEAASKHIATRKTPAADETADETVTEEAAQKPAPKKPSNYDSLIKFGR